MGRLQRRPAESVKDTVPVTTTSRPWCCSTPGPITGENLVLFPSANRASISWIGFVESFLMCRKRPMSRESGPGLSMRSIQTINFSAWARVRPRASRSSTVAVAANAPTVPTAPKDSGVQPHTLILLPPKELLNLVGAHYGQPAPVGMPLPAARRLALKVVEEVLTALRTDYRASR